MTQSSSLQINQDEFDESPPAPDAPLQVDARAGQRWVAVTWQLPAIDAQRPVVDTLLFVSPGQEVICLDASTRYAVLTNLQPARSYTFLVATRNEAGASDWVASVPLRLPPSEPTPRLEDERWDTGLLADLLQAEPAALETYLAAQDDADLLLALKGVPAPVQEQILDLIDNGERVLRLRQRLANSTALVRHSVASVVKPPPTPPPPPEETIVIEVMPHRRIWPGWMALGLLLPVLLLGLYLVWALPQRVPQGAGDPLAGSVEKLEGTVEALVAEREPATATLVPTATAFPTVAAILTVDKGEREPVDLIARASVDLLNVRAGPGEAYPVMTVLAAGEEIAIDGRSADGEWLYISAGEESGWVFAPLVNVQGEVQSLAVQPVPPTPIAAVNDITVTPTPIGATPLVVVPTTTVSPAEATAVSSTEAEANIPVTSNMLAEDPVHPCLVGGYFWLIHPVDVTVRNEITFQWGFSGQLPEICGFEVSLWRAGDAPQGVHDAVADNLNSVIKLTRANEYRLEIPFLSNLPSTQSGSGDYYWTVSIVQVTPEYRSFGRQAEPAYVWIELP